MGDLMVPGSPDHLRKRVLENSKQFVGHFTLGPEEALQALDPFEV